MAPRRDEPWWSGIIYAMGIQDSCDARESMWTHFVGASMGFSGTALARTPSFHAHLPYLPQPADGLCPFSLAKKYVKSPLQVHFTRATLVHL